MMPYGLSDSRTPRLLRQRDVEIHWLDELWMSPCRWRSDELQPSGSGIFPFRKRG